LFYAKIVSKQKSQLTGLKRGEYMRRKISIFLAMIIILSFVLAGCGNREITTSYRLEDDFYDYINDNTLKNTEIPKDSSGWSHFYQLNKNAYEMLNEVLKDTVKNREQFQQGTLEQKIADLYLTALDMDGRQKAGFGELTSYLEQIRSASSVEEYLEAIGKIYNDLGFSSLLAAQWYEDLSDSSRYACYLKRPDLGLGKETLEDVTQAELLTQYQNYIQKMLEASGLDVKVAKQSAADILVLQKDLASSALSLYEQNDPNKTYNLYSKDALKNLFTNVDIEAFLKSAGLGYLDTCIVSEESLMKKVNAYLTEENLALLKNYSVFCLINDFAPFLTPEIRDDHLEWNNKKAGIAQKKSDETLASEMTQNILGFEFGKLYVEKCFAESDKLAIEDMVYQMFDSYKQQIKSLDWMGEETKVAAIKKLDNMRLKIGYPETWPDDYAQAEVVSVENGGTLIDNLISLVKASFVVGKEKVRQPVDKTEWQMTPQTVNAYYNPTGNEIVFPAAILQAPYYDADADFATNLGGIGMVIAHEISHAFDSSGSLYDENGNYHVWWTDEDRAKYEELAERVVAYFDEQDAFEGRKVNGKQTLDENIADLGAMACITSIAGDDVDKLRLLFEQYATIWASKYTDQSMLQRLNLDTHSPAKVRVNAVLSSMDTFYMAYPEITESDGMYVAPVDRVKIW
jgi:putative endopeptidase